MKKFILIPLLLLASISYAQKIRLFYGDLKALKGVRSFNVEFTYDNMTVGKDLTEQQYITDKKAKLNEKEAGRGDSWEIAWVNDRKDRFEPQFRELFAKHSEMSAVDENAEYTLIFKTTRTEPGWNVGVMRAAAFIDAEIWIVETKNPNKVVAKILATKAPGRDAMGFDYETGARLQEAYAKAGKSLGKFLKDETQ